MTDLKERSLAKWHKVLTDRVHWCEPEGVIDDALAAIDLHDPRAADLLDDFILDLLAQHKRVTAPRYLPRGAKRRRRGEYGHWSSRGTIAIESHQIDEGDTRGLPEYVLDTPEETELIIAGVSNRRHALALRMLVMDRRPLRDIHRSTSFTGRELEDLYFMWRFIVLGRHRPAA